MNYGFDRVWAEISLDDLASNYRSLCEYAKNSTLMVVLKSNAYGHGAPVIARELQSLGCRHMALATVNEAAELRENGISAQLLILGSAALENLDDVLKYELTPAVFGYEHGRILSDAAEKRGKKIPVHIKLDTGMSRYGICTKNRLPEAVEEISRIASLPGLKIEGIFSHMPSGEDRKSDAFNRSEISEFSAACQMAEEKGIRFLYKHIAASAAIISYPEHRFNMLRPGILLYGYFPDRSQTAGLDLRPIMQLKARIAQIKTLPAGTSVSYGRTFTADRDTTAAVLGIGYNDGLMRAASNQAHMLVRGKPAKILGKICMNAVMIDITGIEGVNVGDTVTVFGEDSGAYLSIYDYLDAANTIPQEILTHIGPQVPRIYLKNGKAAARQDTFSKTTFLDCK